MITEFLYGSQDPCRHFDTELTLKDIIAQLDLAYSLGEVKEMEPEIFYFSREPSPTRVPLRRGHK